MVVRQLEFDGASAFDIERFLVPSKGAVPTDTVAVELSQRWVARRESRESWLWLRDCNDTDNSRTNL